MNGEVVYSLVHGDALNQFGLDPRTGELSLKLQLDRENISSYGQLFQVPAEF